MSAEVIREFLLKVGWDVDPAGQRRFTDVVKTTTAGAVAMGAAITAAAVAVTAAVSKMATNFESLYYTSQRLGSSAGNIKAFGSAASMLGSSVEDAVGSLEAFGRKLREAPGWEQNVQSLLGVATRQGGKLRDTTLIVEDMGKALAKIPDYWKRLNIAEHFGLSESLMRAISDPKFDEYIKKYNEKMSKFGFNADKAAKEGRDFSNAYRGVFQSLEIIASNALSKLFGPGGNGFEAFDKWLVTNHKSIEENLAAIGRGIGETVKYVGQLVLAFQNMDPKTAEKFKVFMGIAVAGVMLFGGGPLSKLLIIAGAIGYLLTSTKAFAGETDKPLIPEGWLDGLPEGAKNIDLMAVAMGGMASVMLLRLIPAVTSLATFWPVMLAVAAAGGIAALSSIDEDKINNSKKNSNTPEFKALPDIDKQSWGQWFGRMFGGDGNSAPKAGGRPAATINGAPATELGRDTRSFLERLWDRLTGKNGDPSVENGQFGANSTLSSGRGINLGKGGAGGAGGSAGSSDPSGGPKASGGHSRPGAKLSANQREAYDAAIKEGLSPEAAKALVANMSGEALHKPNDYHWDSKHMASGIVQWDPSRAAAIQKQFGKMPHEMSVADQTRAAIWEIRTNPRFKETLQALNEGKDVSKMIRALVSNYENPANHGAAISQRMGHYRNLPSMEKPVAAPKVDNDSVNGRKPGPGEYIRYGLDGTPVAIEKRDPVEQAGKKLGEVGEAAKRAIEKGIEAVAPASKFNQGDDGIFRNYSKFKQGDDGIFRNHKPGEAPPPGAGASLDQSKTVHNTVNVNAHGNFHGGAKDSVDRFYDRPQRMAGDLIRDMQGVT